jgi:SAM-dependent methyltransferase
MSYERAAHLHDLFDQKENIEFFSHYAARAGVVLDVGAGTGRIAVPLAERGVRLVCVEPSPAMRQQFRRKLMGRLEVWDRIRLIPGDAASFQVALVFPMAFLSGVFDHFLDDEQRVAALRNIGRHLVLGGVLVFDLTPGPMPEQPLSPAGTAQVGDREVRRLVGRQRLSPERMAVQIVYQVLEGGEVVEEIEERGEVGLTDRRGVHRVLAEAGFEVRREWGSYHFAAYEDGAPLLAVEAIKTGPASPVAAGYL